MLSAAKAKQGSAPIAWRRLGAVPRIEAKQRHGGATNRGERRSPHRQCLALFGFAEQSRGEKTLQSQALRAPGVSRAKGRRGREVQPLPAPILRGE